VIIAVTVNGQTEVLMDGIITKQDLSVSSAAGKSTFTVTGLDLTALMDFIDLTGIPYPAMPVFVIVELILAKYLPLGVVPLAIPPPLSLICNPIQKFMKQVGTDYAYITSLGRDYGAVFYLDPGPSPGQSMAYWGPNLTTLFGGNQPAISINLDSATTLDQISFSYDGTVVTDYYVTVIEQNSQLPIPIPLPNIDMIYPPQSANAPTALKITPITPIAGDDPITAAAKAIGKLLTSANAVTATGSLDVIRYGQVFKARQLCSVRGGGGYFDGLYYVKSVTHDIKRGEYKQNFSLERGGTGSSIATASP
jgi:hypothetical protein